ncbi:MBL fold metallo-hydrolase [Rubrivivax sp. A210]|uniref:MBL fold metallo-hydrolase n=1 Tax=Rubrivivax sp. A210 TaxID=2772301 RepID=UPI001917A4F5|nr:MBL fold metallo-hydrolase [Rubrivivax sp. A210]CAD5372824.1 MBL fold metallo-hydrolase [Rubrivivax sp. A210]
MPILRRIVIAGLSAVLTATTLPALADAPLLKTQAPGWYRMMLGKFEVTALSDGTVALPVDKLLTNTTADRVNGLLARAYLKTPVETSVNGYLVNTGSKLVLIDAGAAGLFGPTLGKLVANLKAAGYQPEQVDEVYVTHMHPDHVGGLAADGKPVFPNAIVRADGREGDFWLSQANLDKAPADAKGFFQGAMASLNPYAAAGRLKPFDGGGEGVELVPGIRAMAAHGHTPGHSLYIVESEGNRLVVWGDLMHVAAVQFAMPAVTIQFDVDAKAAAPQRKKNYADAARKGYYVAVAHVAFPGIGKLRADGRGYQWIPANYQSAP